VRAGLLFLMVSHWLGKSEVATSSSDELIASPLCLSSRVQAGPPPPQYAVRRILNFMTTLSEHDASALLAFVSELRDLDDPLSFPPQLLARLRALIEADFVSYGECDPVARTSIFHAWHHMDGENGIVWGENDALACSHELWWSLRSTHPSWSYRIASGDWTTAWKVSDFVTLHEFRRSAIYEAFYRGYVDHMLDVGLAAEQERTRLFVFTRFDNADFDERDRLVAALLQPHLAERAEAAEAALHAAEAMAAIEEGTIEEARRIVLCSASGVIEFGSASSRALLERYLELDNGRVPTWVLARRGFTLRHRERSLRFSIAPMENLYLLMLEERDLRVEKLTAREREVLEHVVVGRRNEAIAHELGIAPATVAKHLEHAYRKLGVQNRIAAGASLGSTGPSSVP
jgi:DNA-binding NarL/FixJ family response regulator